jgi:hypothetical protein
VKTRSKLLATAIAIGMAGTISLLGTSANAASPTVAPGGNFNLSVWELQEPVGSPGSPTTIPSSELQGANGFQDSYFYTDTRDGAMTFWAPEKGVTTPNSNYARSELREMNSNGTAADWALSGTHKLSATLRVVSVTSHVCVGQIHLGTGGSSTKPLVELYYYNNGNIVVGTEDSPSGGQTTHTVGTVAIGKTWSYVLGVSGGNTINLTVNGTTTHYAIPSSFDVYKEYFTRRLLRPDRLPQLTRSHPAHRHSMRPTRRHRRRAGRIVGRRCARSHLTP